MEVLPVPTPSAMTHPAWGSMGRIMPSFDMLRFVYAPITLFAGYIVKNTDDDVHCNKAILSFLHWSFVCGCVSLVGWSVILSSTDFLIRECGRALLSLLFPFFLFSVFADIINFFVWLWGVFCVSECLPGRVRGWSSASGRGVRRRQPLRRGRVRSRLCC